MSKKLTKNEYRLKLVNILSKAFISVNTISKEPIRKKFMIKMHNNYILAERKRIRELFRKKRELFI